MAVQRASKLIDEILFDLNQFPNRPFSSLASAQNQSQPNDESKEEKKEEIASPSAADNVPSEKKLSAKQLKKLAKQKKKEAKQAKQKAAAEANKKKKAKPKREKKVIELPSHFLHDPKTTKKQSLSEPMAATYDPAAVENEWDSIWENSGFYKPEMGSDKEKFVMVIPPPNVTGSLHLGHALMVTIEDTITRYWRMKGKNCLWLPGTDHAGIATQSVVERRLARQGRFRHEMKREDFLKEVWTWKEDFGGQICNQIRKMGCSVDWDREVFTMDPSLSRSVTEAFVRMYESGLIYRDNRLCHWSCSLRSAISNAEVDLIQLDDPKLLSVPGYDRKIKFGILHKFGYKVVDSDEQLIVATTRLETMLGDTAVAVHPEDPRYKHLHGKRVQHPFLDRTIPIVTDPVLVDMEFGTGAVKITPAHDENDFECGKRHKLDFITIFTEDGQINENGGKFKGMKRFSCRYELIKELTKLGQFYGEEPNKMSLQLCSRSHDVIEPYLKPQWWVECGDMAKRSLEVVDSGKLVIRPPEGVQQWHYFLDNIRPWCISRQLWWGHRIPAYLVTLKDGTRLDESDKNSWVVARDEKEAFEKACKRFEGKFEPDNIVLEQDPDVLDTWFSSGLFPFSTMGWPDSSAPDLKEFFPGHLLETGGDILFFWVARMVMMSLQLMDVLPFTEVYLHPMVRDKDGSKMSKSKGNVINPLHIINGVELQVLLDELHSGNIKDSEVKIYEKKKKADYPNGIPSCGSDALRFGLLNYLTQGRSINLDVQRVVGYRQFCNKIWNAVRFAMANFDKNYDPPSMDHTDLAAFWDKKDYKEKASPCHYWILSRLSAAVAECEASNPKYDFAQSTNATYQFFLKELCDVYLEVIKPIFYNARDNDITTIEQKISQDVLYICLDWSFKLMHPFMPFVTEELWQRLPGRSTADALIVQSYPTPVNEWNNAQSEEEMTFVLNSVREIRSAKQNLFGLSTKTKYAVYLKTDDEMALKRLRRHAGAIRTLSMSSECCVCDTDEKFEWDTMFQTELCDDSGNSVVKVYHKVKDLVKWEKRAQKFNTELKKSEKEIQSLTNEIQSCDKPALQKKMEATLQQKQSDLKDLQHRIVLCTKMQK